MTSKNWTGIGEVTVRAFNGQVRVFPSLAAAVAAIGRRQIEAITDRPLGFGFDSYLNRDRTYYRSWSYAMSCEATRVIGSPLAFFDCLGMRIPAWKVQETLANLDTSEEDRHPYFRRRPHTFRSGPVPGLYSHYRRSYDRHPGTRNELRAAEGYRADLEDLDVRPKGRVRDLPTYYDDLPRSRGYSVKSWKEYRRTQYKEGAR